MLCALFGGSHGGDSGLGALITQFSLLTLIFIRKGSTSSVGGEYPICRKTWRAFVDADYDTDNWFERAKGMECSLSAVFGVPCALICAFERTALCTWNMGSA